MRGIRILAHPALPIIALAGIYVLVRVESGQRAHMFALLATTTFGAAELALVLIALAKRRAQRLASAVRLLNGGGALLMATALLNGLASLRFIAGALLFSTGMFLELRAVFDNSSG